MRFPHLMPPTPEFVKAFGIAFCALIVLGVLASKLFPQKGCQNLLSPDDAHKKTYPGGFTKPVIALELVASGDDVQQILANTDCRNFQRRGLIFDTFVFIPLYWCILAGQCWLLAYSRPSVARIVGVLALACATLAVVFDYMENYFMWSAVNSTQTPTDLLAESIRYPALCKWALSFITLALLSLLFFRAGGWGIIISGGYLLSFFIGIYGVVDFHHRPLIETASYPLLLAALPFAYLFIWKAHSVIESLDAS